MIPTGRLCCFSTTSNPAACLTHPHLPLMHTAYIMPRVYNYDHPQRLRPTAFRQLATIFLTHATQYPPPPGSLLWRCPQFGLQSCHSKQTFCSHGFHSHSTMPGWLFPPFRIQPSYPLCQLHTCFSPLLLHLLLYGQALQPAQQHHHPAQGTQSQETMRLPPCLKIARMTLTIKLDYQDATRTPSAVWANTFPWCICTIPTIIQTQVSLPYIYIYNSIWINHVGIYRIDSDGVWQSANLSELWASKFHFQSLLNCLIRLSHDISQWVSVQSPLSAHLQSLPTGHYLNTLATAERQKGGLLPQSPLLKTWVVNYAMQIRYDTLPCSLQAANGRQQTYELQDAKIRHVFASWCDNRCCWHRPWLTLSQLTITYGFVLTDFDHISSRMQIYNKFVPTTAIHPHFLSGGLTSIGPLQLEIPNIWARKKTGRQMKHLHSQSAYTIDPIGSGPKNAWRMI